MEKPFHSPVLTVLFLVCAWASTGDLADAAQSDTGSPSYFALPIEVDFDSGAANGDAVIGRLIPVTSIPMCEEWRLLNIAIVVVADAPGARPGTPGNPESTESENVFGLGDITDAFLYTPTRHRGVSWGLGAIMGIPTATDDVLGSGKWSLGPAARILHEAGPWRLSLLAGNLRSFAGDADREDINQLVARGIVRRKLPRDWFFIYTPIITANWNADADQRWLIPLGGGFGKQIVFGSTQLNVSAQAYWNVVKPDGAPDSVFRIGFTLPIRVPGGS